MPRNLVSGVYSAPAGTFGVTGAPISSTAYNNFVNDIGAEITNSVDPRGETPMVANLNLGSNRIINLATGITATDAATVGQVSALVPAGHIILWAGPGTSPPTGWLLCDGSAVSRTTFATLFGIIGTAFGTGDGSTTFNIPNMIDKVGVGAKTSSAGSFALASTGGEINHTLVTAELAVHTHTVNDPGHNHAISDPGHNHPDPGHTHGATQSGHSHTYNETVISGVGASLAGGAQGSFSVQSTSVVAPAISVNGATTGIQLAGTGVSVLGHATGVTNATAGAGSAHNNMQPYVGINYIIKI